MEMARLDKFVQKVIQLQRDDEGNVVPTVVYRKRQRKTKVSSGLKPVEKSIRRMAKAHETLGDSYLRRHKRSNRKRRDGWISDLGSNITNAGRKARKPLRIRKNYLRVPARLV